MRKIHKQPPPQITVRYYSPKARNRQEKEKQNQETNSSNLKSYKNSGWIRSKPTTQCNQQTRTQLLKRYYYYKPEETAPLLSGTPKPNQTPKSQQKNKLKKKLFQEPNWIPPPSSHHPALPSIQCVQPNRASRGANQEGGGAPPTLPPKEMRSTSTDTTEPPESPISGQEDGGGATPSHLSSPPSLSSRSLTNRRLSRRCCRRCCSASTTCSSSPLEFLAPVYI